MKSITFLLLFVTTFSHPIQAQDISLDSTTLTLRDVATGIQVPWEILWGPDAHIWVTERRGRVLRIEPESGNITTILNIESKITATGEPGLLGMALHPDFPDTALVYLVYTYTEPTTGDIRERLVTYEWNGTKLSNENTLLNDIDGGNIHNGSRLLVTRDRKLLMTTGETGSGNLSQNKANLNGKVLRLNLDGSIPSDNPFPNSYIWSFGHRNPQGLCLGRDTLIYSSEHGAQQSDEFNLIQKGRNYGWPKVEGKCNTSNEMTFCTNNNVREPLMEWTPCVAVNGLWYYDHPAIPEWQNKVLMTVLGGFVKLPRLSVLTLSANGQEVVEEKQYAKTFGRLRDLCVNPKNGAVYIATNGANYPGGGPNRIIEYRNLSYKITAAPTLLATTQYLRIAPNPMSDEGTLEFSENFLGSSYEIIDFNSQIISTGTVSKTQMPLSMQSFPAGFYFVRATNGLGTVTKIFVKN
jgi:aldose sugar dehydrogenase